MSSRAIQFRKPQRQEPDPPAAAARQPLFEKSPIRATIRFRESLKEQVDRRARARKLTFSAHVIDLVMRDLERKEKSGMTLSDTARELKRALELAEAGVERDEQRKWIQQRVNRFSSSLWGTA